MHKTDAQLFCAFYIKFNRILYSHATQRAEKKIQKELNRILHQTNKKDSNFNFAFVSHKALQIC